MVLLALLLPSGEVHAQASEGTISSNGAELYYRTIGSGEPILVIHGGPGLGHDYLLPGMEGLAETHRLIFYDQRGSARSTATLDGTTIHMDLFLEDITAIQEELGLTSVNILGHSFGGLIGMLYALEHPDRVDSLILMNSVEPGQRYAEETAANQAEATLEEDAAVLDSLFQSPELAAGDAGAMSRMLSVSFRSTFADRSLADRLMIDLDASTAANFVTVNSLLLEPLRGFDYWDRLSEISAPTLVLHGVADPIPSTVAEEITVGVPNAELILIDGAGHFPYIERPDETFAAIGAFLRSR